MLLVELSAEFNDLLMHTGKKNKGWIFKQTANCLEAYLISLWYLKIRNCSCNARASTYTYILLNLYFLLNN